jgi:N-acyl-D-amino-acid deacylase
MASSIPLSRGTIVDGTLVPPYRADVGIKNGVITKIGRLKSSDATQVLDASGLIVARGQSIARAL